MAKNSSVRIDTTGLDRLIREEPARVNAWLRGVADQMMSDIVLSFNTSPAGVTYQRGSVSHTASQPGYPPNVDIGTLQASMHVEPQGALEFWIADGVEYGIYLEDGTERMQARPFVQPVFDAWSRRIADDAKKNLGLE